MAVILTLVSLLSKQEVNGGMFARVCRLVPVGVQAEEGVCVCISLLYTLPRAPDTTLSAPLTKDD